MQIVLIRGHFERDHASVVALRTKLQSAGINFSEPLDRPSGAVSFLPCIAALYTNGVAAQCFGTSATNQQLADAASANGTQVEPAPVAAELTRLAFVRLCQRAGGMTDQMLVDCYNDANFAAMWIKFRIAEDIVKSDIDTQDGLNGLGQAGYLPNGAAAVNAAWPT